MSFRVTTGVYSHVPFVSEKFLLSQHCVLGRGWEGAPTPTVPLIIRLWLLVKRIRGECLSIDLVPLTDDPKDRYSRLIQS